jgi:hypothetical protein
MHSSSQNIHSKLAALAWVLLLSALWLLMRGYHGLSGDAQIYAFQALARIHPHLATDLYLQNTSQDRFTIFSPFYAWCIGLFGLENAARLLTVIFTFWLLAAAWKLARILASRDAAWLATAFLLIVAGDYGASGVFRISEQYLTARLPAEALILTALACCVSGKNRLSVLLASAALLVHPLIALPGVLLLLCMWLPSRAIAAGAIGMIMLTLGFAAAAARLRGIQALALMDPAWLEVVRERSQFLFLPLWSAHDWDVNTQPFVYLAFTAIAVPDPRIRKLCTGSALVGMAGLAVALIGSLIGPVAILVQGQAWRWIWIAVFVSALLLPVTAMHAWRDDRCGPICVILLVSGWTLSGVDGTACASLALILWVMRANIGDRAALFFRCAATALAAAIVAWILARSSALLWPAAAASGASLRGMQVRDIFGLRTPAVLFGILVWWTIQRSRDSGGKIWAPILVAAALLMISIFVWPAAFKQSHSFASASEMDEFADWRNAIPPTSTVLVVPARDVGAFVWFILQRPNYLALDQSAGVVFSRATALEVQRRSEVLLPLMEPNWKIMTGLANARSGRKGNGATRPLTAKNLIHICADPQLGFVISPIELGLESLRHQHAGAWADSNLYDCRTIRSSMPAT